MALLNAISLQMFQNKMKFSLTVPSGSPAEHLKMFRKCVLSAMINALVTIIHILREVLESAKCSFMRFRVSLIFSVINSPLIFVLSMYIMIKYSYIKYNINPIEKSDKNHNNKEGKCKYCIEKFD